MPLNSNVTYNPVSTALAAFAALPGPVAPVGPSGLLLTGNVFYVQSINSAAADNTQHGGTPQTPFKTLNFALTLVTPNNGDVIYVLPGHVESVVGAAGLNFATGCDGVTVFFMGSAAERAQINLGTATTAQVVIAANNVTLVAPRFVAALDAIVAAVSITGSDCTLINVEYFDATAIYTLIQVITTNAAKRLTINGYTYYEGTAGTTKTEAIRIVGGDHHRLTNLNITGSFSTATLNNVTTATTAFMGSGWYLNNLSGPATAVFVSTSTFSGVGDSSPHGAGVIEYGATKGPLTIPGSTTQTIFTVVGGPIQVMLLGGLVTTAIGGTSTNLKFSAVITTPSGTVDLCTNGAITSKVAGNLFIPVTSFATALPVTLTGGIGPVAASTLNEAAFVMGPGTIIVTTDATTTGAIQYFLRYKPLVPGVFVY